MKLEEYEHILRTGTAMTPGELANWLAENLQS